jgi:hypothetical protein
MSNCLATTSSLRTFERVMLFFAAAECEIDFFFEQAAPSVHHKSQAISFQPLKRVSKLLALLVSCYQSRRGRSKRGGGGNRLRLTAYPEHTSIDGRAGDARTGRLSKIWRQGNNDAPCTFKGKIVSPEVDVSG